MIYPEDSNGSPIFFKNGAVSEKAVGDGESDTGCRSGDDGDSLCCDHTAEGSRLTASVRPRRCARSTV